MLKTTVAHTGRSKEVSPGYSRYTTVFGFFPSLRLIRAFSAVAELRSISKASTELNLSQSAVTQAIVKLEADLDTRLFERRNNGSYLTDTGIILKEHTDNIILNLEAALEQFASALTTGSTITQMLARRVTKSQIVALISIKEAASFTQAAFYAGVSQPSIHRAARTLESHLNTKLFYNTAHGSTVNEQGYRLANRLHLTVREFEWAYEKIEAQKMRERGRILVGGLPLAGSGFLASAISGFIGDHPEVNIDIATSSYDILLEKLRAGALDFIVGTLRSPPPTDDVIEEVLAPDPYVIVVRRGHPLANKAVVTREDLAAYDWLLPGPTAARRANYEKLFSDFSPTPRTNIGAHSLTIIFLLLTESDRMTILTRSQLLLDQRLGHNLTTINHQLEESIAYIGVTTRKNWTPTQNQAVFMDFLRRTRVEDSRFEASDKET